MASVKLNDVSVDIPVFNAKSRSFKNKMVRTAINPRINSHSSGCVLVRALQGINLNMAEGEKVGVLGGNGSGKSTLLRVLSGVYKPSSGGCKIDGKVGSLIDISLGIDPEASGRENVFIRGGLLGINRKSLENHIEDIKDFSGLEGFFDMPVRTYSSGMQLRLAFSVSTILEPEILLMDEWLSVGDDEFRKKTEYRLQGLLESTSILVIASHSMDLLKKVCNRVIWLESGMIKMDGSPDEVIHSYLTSGEVA